MKNKKKGEWLMIEMQEVDKNYNDFHFHLSMKYPKDKLKDLLEKMEQEKVQQLN